MTYRKISRREMSGCVLCREAPCTAACGKLDPGAMLRSIWFGNEKAAAFRLPAEDLCAGCGAPCEAACVRAGEVPIRGLMARLRSDVAPELEIPAMPEELLTETAAGRPSIFSVSKML